MSFRATKALGNAAKAGAGGAGPKSADPWKYHLGDKSPFWKKFRETLVVNPESTTGNWITTKFRDPQPGSRPEKYALPPTKASDPAQNAYFERDYRRQYPRLDVITQTDLSALLLAQPEQLGLPLPNNAPAKAAAEGTTDITTIPSPAPSLSSLYLAPTSDKSEATTFYTPSKLPPMPVSGVKLSWAPSEEVPPHDEFAYFPMTNYSSSVQEQQATERGHDTARTGVSNKVGADA